MNVLRLWLALTSLVLRGKGGYDVYMWLENTFDADDRRVADVRDVVNWKLHGDAPGWVGGGDRFISLTFVPENPPWYLR